MCVHFSVHVIQHFPNLSDHRCTFPGCKNVIVLDGNMKNQHDICYAKDAGFVHYPGLPGQIKTACVASPAFKSRFCHQHSTRSCPSSISKKEGTCTCTYMYQYIVTNSTHTWHMLEVGTLGAVVELLLADKEARGSKYYQVFDTVLFVCMYCKLMLICVSGTMAWDARCTHNLGASFLPTNRSHRHLYSRAVTTMDVKLVPLLLLRIQKGQRE